RAPALRTCSNFTRSARCFRQYRYPETANTVANSSGIVTRKTSGMPMLISIPAGSGLAAAKQRWHFIPTLPGIIAFGPLNPQANIGPIAAKPSNQTPKVANNPATASRGLRISAGAAFCTSGPAAMPLAIIVTVISTEATRTVIFAPSSRVALLTRLRAFPGQNAILRRLYRGWSPAPHALTGPHIHHGYTWADKTPIGLHGGYRPWLWCAGFA